MSEHLRGYKLQVITVQVQNPQRRHLRKRHRVQRSNLVMTQHQSLNRETPHQGSPLRYLDSVLGQEERRQFGHDRSDCDRQFFDFVPGQIDQLQIGHETKHGSVYVRETHVVCIEGVRLLDGPLSAEI